ncbi:hypothetical protein M9458_014886, partial [Cirrhinus mrigala]
SVVVLKVCLTKREKQVMLSPLSALLGMTGLRLRWLKSHYFAGSSPALSR